MRAAHSLLSNASHQRFIAGRVCSAANAITSSACSARLSSPYRYAPRPTGAEAKGDDDCPVSRAGSPRARALPTRSADHGEPKFHVEAHASLAQGISNSTPLK
ncbi:hypothetical protein [Vibrio penaeicida]|uniref:hypothetical protein n=1 Tax=Vibrio penaeicida TaxID=104609 RepID=UPI001CC7E3FE|nr:hypothetical protein [Vibrio penaeicida]